MSSAWACYLPVPLLRTALVLAAPTDRLLRFHAWQGRVVVWGTLAIVMLLGLLGMLSDATWYQASLGLPAGLALIVYVFYAAKATAGAAAGRYTRVGPAYALLSALGR